MQNKVTIKDQSTLAIFEPDEVWEVRTQDKTYRLTGTQAQGLKEATSQGLRGLIWFKDFAISIPHITSVSKLQKSKKILEKNKKEYASKFGF